jgi:ribonuclease P protein component
VSSGSYRIWRIRDRTTFGLLRARGRTVRRGVVSVRFLADGRSDPPRVAYAVGKTVGPAVDRNRVRRRLRAVVADLHRGPDGPLPSGAYLVRATPESAAAPVGTVREDLESALRELRP